MPNQITLPVGGMSCASCAGRVERALAAVEGVQEAAVNLARKTVSVRYDSPVDLPGLVSTLETAGYPALVSQTQLTITSMSCASCSGRVARGLAATPGVVDAQVNLATETASIGYIAGVTSPTELAQQVTDQGYPAEVKQSDTPSDPRDKQDEIATLRQQVLLAALLALPVFVIEMGGHLVPSFHHWVQHSIGSQTSRVLQFILTSAVLFGPGWGLLRTGFSHLIRATPEMNSLVALGSSAAYGYSVLATFAPALLPAAANHVYFEAAAVIIVLILTGRWLEARAKGRTGAAIARLIGLRPKTARVLRGTQAVDLPIEEIVVGDQIQTRPGETIATDGEVIEGRSFVDESMVTGEPVPVEKSSGAALVGGTINGSGALTFRATKVGKDTMLAQIIALVEQAQGAKLPIQGLVDRITFWFVPAVMAAAVLTVLVWLIFGPDPVLTHALAAGVAVLIIACPCAMGLATPTSVMVGTGRAAELGVLFRKGDALQSLSNCAVVALDKTGTLTQGRPELVGLTLTNGFQNDDVLGLAASVEARSEHPIADAITRAAQQKNLHLHPVIEFIAVPGFGVSAMVDGRRVQIGADRYLQREGMDLSAFAAETEQAAKSGQTPLFVAIDGVPAALITVADPIKPGARNALNMLRDRGLKIAMITGDNTHTAQAIAADLGIDSVTAEVLPDGKTTALEALRAQHGPVAFVGDGINDAPALAAADVGLAIGTGSDVAIETGDVVLISGELSGLVNAVDMSHKTLGNIRQNLFWAFGYNILLIPVAAGVLYPVFGILLSPMLGAGAMALSSVFVLSNALRLRYVGGEARVATGAGDTGETA